MGGRTWLQRMASQGHTGRNRIQNIGNSLLYVIEKKLEEPQVLEEESSL